MPRVASDIGDLLDALARGTFESDDAGVSLLEHSLQTAALIAHHIPADTELQAAGLLHDVGSCLAPRRPRTHARAGAAFIAELLGPRAAWLVANHDVAKRYLVTTAPDYWTQLSDHSRTTFQLQGGMLSTRERLRVSESPWMQDLLALRRADDLARMPGRGLPELDAWSDALESVATAWRDRVVRSREL